MMAIAGLLAAQEVSSQRLADSKTFDMSLLGKSRQPRKNIFEDERATVIRPSAPRPANAVAEAADGTLIMGNLVYQDSWTVTMDTHYGMQTFRPEATLGIQTLKEDGELFAKGGGTVYGDRFRYFYYQEGQVPVATYYEWDINTWIMQRRQTDVNLNLLGFDTAYDPTTGEVYGSFWDVTEQGLVGFVFGTIDYDNLTRKALRSLGAQWYVAMAADADGELFAINRSGDLLRLNKATGEETLIGATGVRPTTYEQSATFDLATGKLYWQVTPQNDTSHLYEVDTTTGRATRLATFPDGESYMALYIESPGTADGAPSKVTGMSLSFEGGQTDGSVAFTLPLTSVGGDALQGTLSYIITSNGLILASGEGQPGEPVSRNVSVGQGIQKFGVRASNEAGLGEFTFLSQYVGYDEPNPVRNLQLTIDNNTRQATLSWQRPLTYRGVNGGYVDANAITYTVVRHPGALVVADHIAATTFTETLPGGALTTWYYTVVANNGSMSSAPVSTQAVVAGDALVPPYFEGFDEYGAEDYYNILDMNGDGMTWTFERHNYFAARCETANKANDWLITPPLQLEGGRLYQLRFVAFGSPVVQTANKLSVGIGRGNAVADYEELFPETVVPARGRRYFSKMVSVSETGNYNLGFHCTSDAGSVYLFLDSIDVAAPTTAAAPAAVGNLRLQPADMGQHRVGVSFTAPTTALDGTPLEAISRIDVYRNENRLVKTFSQPAPGSTLQFTDEDTEYGDLRYTVAATNDGGTGERVSAFTHVGQDVPGSVSNVGLKVIDDRTLQLSWTPPTSRGAAGGYVNPDELTYYITDKYQNPLQTAVSGTTFTFDEPRLSSGDQELLYYWVAAVSEAGRSSYVRSANVVGGAPLQLPFHEGFAGGAPHNYWSITGNGENRFNCATFTGRDADGDNGILYFWAGADYDESTIKSAKIDLGSAQHPGLLFSYAAQAGADMLLTVQVDNGQGDAPEDIFEIDYLEVEPNDEATTTEDWRKAFVPLDKFKALPYVRICFKAEAGEADNESVVILDDINVFDVFSDNLKAAALTVQPQGVVGQAATVGVKVSNTGLNDAGNFTVSLLANGEVVATTTVGSLPSFTDRMVNFSYTPRQTDGKTLTFQAVVSYDADEDLADNTSVTADMTLMLPSWPMAQNLTGTEGPEGVTLSWTAPDLTPAAQTEDFENYTAWSTDGLGLWTLYDADGGSTQLTTDRSATPHVGEAYAYMIYNPYLLGLDLQTYTMYEPYSGQQYAVSTVSAPATTAEGHNDDWLISPPLSGEAQTVSVWSRSAVQGIEQFEFRYSTTDARPESLTNLVRTVRSVPSGYWVNYLFDVPDGARHFALRTTTADGYALFFDDITFVPEPFTLTGYRVYRDGEALATLGPDATTYTDIASGSHRYQLTCLYTVGESQALTAAVSTGMASARTDWQQADVEVFTTGGVLVASGRDAARRLPRGVYVVRSRSDGSVKVRSEK